MMDQLTQACLIGAAVTMGIAAGVYQLYSIVIMPGLGRTTDRTFVEAFQEIDRAIVGPYLLVIFLGPLALTGAAAGLTFASDERAGLLWIVAAFALCLLITIQTIAINVPLNDGIKGAGAPDAIDATAVRRRFNEPRWVLSNHVRALAATVAFGCLVWAVVLQARV